MIRMPIQGANLNIFKLIQARVEKLPPFLFPSISIFIPERWRLAVLRCSSVIFPPPLKSSPARSQPFILLYFAFPPSSLPLLPASSSTSRSRRFISRSPTTSSLPPSPPNRFVLFFHFFDSIYSSYESS